MNRAYVNGDFLPLERASVPVLDRGLLFADAAYEVIPAYEGNLFRLPQHLERLDNSLHALSIPNPHSHKDWTNLLNTLVKQSGGGDLALYLQVTRGSQPRREALPDSSVTQPYVIAFCQALNAMTEETREQGIEALTLPDPRWRDCHIKSTALLPNVLARRQADQRGAGEALLMRDGELMEGTASNVFVVLNGIVVTPPKNRHMLPGITRDLVLELAAAHRVPHAEQIVFQESLPKAKELWLSSSTRELVPITRLNGAPVGDGKPGPLWRQLYELLQQYKDTPA